VAARAKRVLDGCRGSGKPRRVAQQLPPNRLTAPKADLDAAEVLGYVRNNPCIKGEAIAAEFGI